MALKTSIKYQLLLKSSKFVNLIKKSFDLMFKNLQIVSSQFSIHNLHFFKTWIILFVFLVINQIGTSQNVSSVDVNSVSNAEIQKVQNEFEKSGLTEDEAINLARMRGATEKQINDLKLRLQGNSSNIDTVLTNYNQSRLINSNAQTTDEISIRKAPITKSAKIFGSDLFNSENLTFEPTLNIQTPKNYELGINDQIIINIWGNSQNNYQLTVNNNGQIIIPDVGPVYVAGLTFKKAEQKIKQRLTSIYADMGGNNPQTFAQFNLGQLRSIRVNITGEITAPGTYTLPVTATVFNALYLSGGPDSIGSFRNIKVIRDNKTLRTIDIYKFLVDANPEDNIQLKDNDIIFVPTIEIRTNVEGELRRNGLFEMKPEESVADLVRFAGGFTDDSYWQNLQVRRNTLNGYKLLDIPFSEAQNIILKNGDELTNGKINERFENRVSITGAVYRPGDYAWEENMTISNLIEKADSLQKDAFMPRGIIFRENPDLTTSNIAFNVEEIILGKNNIFLQPEDSVVIKSQFDLREERFITVSGEVINPGNIEWVNNLTIANAIFLSGGLTEAADSAYIEVARRLSYKEASKTTEKLVTIFTTKICRNLSMLSEEENFILQPFDRIAVRRAPGFREQISAMVTGEVNYAGTFAINNKNQKISDLINLAGGITPYGFLDGATLTRETDLGHENVAINMEQILNNPGSEIDLLLRNGDSLYIPEYLQTVKVSGNVQSPFSITYEKGKSLKYYIDKCGGYSTEALKRKVYVKYANGSTASTKSFCVKNYPEIRQGSEIIVPQKPEKQNMESGKWLAIASAFSSIAVAIAAIF